MSTPTLSVEWQCYAECSERTHRRRCDAFGNGSEEQCCKILDDIAKATEFTLGVRESIERLPWNRAKKHIRLQRCIRRRAEQFDRERQQRRACPGPDTAVLDLLAPTQFAIETRLAEGESYCIIACDLGVAEGALKMKVSRWRQEVRAAFAIT